MSGKTALVLSAGGMFGAYQAGAWQVLAEHFRPDMVIGASAGALNAWAIAGGAKPTDLIEYWLDPVGAHLASFRLLQPPWLGVFDARPLHTRIEKLWHTYRPGVEIGIVATELGTLRPRLFRNAEIGWRHLAASCAVLTCYPQVRLGAKLYSDGGLLGALPLWAAAEMGAERIVAVDALPVLPSRLVHAAVRGFQALAPKPSAVPPGVRIRVVAHPERLGTLREAVFWKEAAVRRAIALGREDAGRVRRETPDWP